MDAYSVSFVDSSGKISSQFDFGAGAEIEIDRLTKLLGKACDEQNGGFELRRGNQIIGGRKPAASVVTPARNRWIRSVTIGTVAVLAFSAGFLITSDHIRLGESHDRTLFDFKQRLTPRASNSQISRGLPTDQVRASRDGTAMRNEAMLKAYAEYQRIHLGQRSSDEQTGVHHSNGKAKRSARSRYEKSVFRRRSRSFSSE
jgi:hypothetical protein